YFRVAQILSCQLWAEGEQRENPRLPKPAVLSGKVLKRAEQRIVRQRFPCQRFSAKRADFRFSRVRSKAGFDQLKKTRDAHHSVLYGCQVQGMTPINDLMKK